MVEFFTGATTRLNGVATTAMKGVVTPGILTRLDSAVTTLECFAENIPRSAKEFRRYERRRLVALYPDFAN